MIKTRLTGFPDTRTREPSGRQSPFFMYLLYLDESGNPDNPADSHFVLGGAALFERVTYFISTKLDEIKERHFSGKPPVEFHASPILAGTGFWRKVAKETKQEIVREIIDVVANANDPGLVLFAAVIEKTDQLYGEEAVRKATEQVCERFDTFLIRRYNEQNDRQRGLIVFAESHFTARSKIWVRGFRQFGTQWGILRNLADIPYFAATRETRLLQLADFVSHAVYRLYEKGDASLLSGLLHRFDRKDGILHGLLHFTPSFRTCDCPACWSRRTPFSYGPRV